VNKGLGSATRCACLLGLALLVAGCQVEEVSKVDPFSSVQLVTGTNIEVQLLQPSGMMFLDGAGQWGWRTIRMGETCRVGDGRHVAVTCRFCGIRDGKILLETRETFNATSFGRGTTTRQRILAVAPYPVAESQSPSSHSLQTDVSLTNYVARAQRILFGTVYRHTDDQRVVFAPTNTAQVIKGPNAHAILQGEIGQGTTRAPVTRFMKPGEQFLVFVFPDNTVGSLGGILPVRDGQLVVRSMAGFTGGQTNQADETQFLPLPEALRQVKAALAVVRANDLRNHVADFRLGLAPHEVVPPQRRFRGLTLTVGPDTMRAPVDPLHPRLQITAAEALRIIDSLAADGFFERARDGGPGDNPRPNYTLVVGAGNMIHEHLGWGVPLRQRLQVLRQALSGDAANEMDLLLAVLSELDSRAADKPPAPGPAERHKTQ